MKKFLKMGIMLSSLVMTTALPIVESFSGSAPAFQTYVENNPFVVVKIFATWCPPCQKFGPIFEAVSNDLASLTYAGQPIKFLSVNFENKEVTSMLGVRSIPMVFIFKNGKNVWSHVGLMRKTPLINAIQNYL